MVGISHCLGDSSSYLTARVLKQGFDVLEIKVVEQA